MNPTPASPDPDRLRRTLDATATGLDLDLAEPAQIAGRGRRRRRHRRLVGGGAVVALAIGSAVVLANGSDDSTVSTSDSVPPASSAPAPPTTGALPTAPATTPPPSTEPTSTTQVPVSDTAPASGAVAIEAVDVAGVPEQFGRLVPFGDGFVMITTSSLPRPLPDRFPDEIRDLFPPEVIELFPEGLPPSVEDATQVLQDAGLLDEVSQVLADHPEAYDAIYGSGPIAETTEVWATVDGASWTRAELDAGLAYPEATTSAGRLVAWSMSYDTDGTAAGATIAFSDDLTSWQFIDLEFGDDRSLPDHITTDRWVDTVAIAGDRWYALVSGTVNVDWMAILPSTLMDEIGDRAWGLSYEANEVTVDFVTSEGQVERTFTFDELGLSADHLDDLDHAPVAQLLTGPLDGTSPPEEVDLPGRRIMAHSRALLTVGDGDLLYAGDAIYVSSDGRTWTQSADLPDDVFIESAVPLGEDVLLAGHGPDPTPALYRWSGDRELDVLSTPELGGHYGFWDSRPTPAWIVQLTPEIALPTIEFEVDHNELHYEIVDDQETFTIVVTDTESGDVLLDRVIPPEERDELFNSISAGAQEFLPITDDAGVEIDRLPAELVVDAYLSASDAASGVGELEMDFGPDVWLVATADGEEWLIRDLPDPTPDSGPWESTIAVANGDRLLIFDGADWSVEMLP